MKAPEIEYDGVDITLCGLCDYRREIIVTEWTTHGPPMPAYACGAFDERLETRSPLFQPILHLKRCKECVDFEKENN